MVKNPLANAGDVRDSGLIPGSGRSPGGGHGNPFQYCCQENPMDKGAWWAIQSMGLKRVRYNRATKHSTAHARNWENILLMKEQVDINFGNRNKHTKNAHRF